jgi:cellulose synthase/poly-beta-1,6-N-acetylglucosamine synthase-like glycosyltransferase
MSNLAQALRAASPRLTPPPTPLRSLAIHGGVLVLWLALFVQAFLRRDVFAWSTGMVYVLYDTLLIVFVAVQTWPLLRASKPGADAVSRRSLGIIVAAHNEGAVLEVTLAALSAQADPPDSIVIADDGSTDNTAALLATRYGLAPPELGTMSPANAAWPALRWLRLPHGGKARALNEAVGLIDTDIVLTVDGDTLLHPGAIGAMRRAFSAEPELVAATGVLTPVCSHPRVGQILQWFQTYEYIRNFLSRYAWMRVQGLLLISGAFAGFRRDALLTVGGFDPDCLVEDYELIHRLRRYGVHHGLDWRTRVLGDALARTDAPSTVPAFLRQRRRWFGGFLQTQYWYRDMVGDPRFGALGTLMLPVKAVDTLQPIYGLSAFVLLLYYLGTGRFDVVLPVSGIIGGKIVIDLAFHLWSVALYRRWVGDRTSARLAPAVLAALAEPFSFQLLRHLGASWGWVVFLTGRRQWGTQRRFMPLRPDPSFGDTGDAG